MAEQTPLSIIRTGQPFPDGVQPKGINFLLINEGSLPRIDRRFNQIQETLKAEVGGMLPQILVDPLGLAALRWQSIESDALPVLLVGTNQQSEGPIALRDATGIIEIERSPYSFQDNKVLVDYLRVAGVAQVPYGGSRVFAAAFDARNRRVGELGISVASSEFPPEEAGSFKRNFDQATSPIPTEPGRARETASLITDAMVQMTGEGGKPHPYLLRARMNYYPANARPLLTLGDPVESPYVEPSLTESTGFSLGHDSGIYVVRFRGYEQVAWDASFPAELSQ